jgi:hypothetical protein
MATAGAVIALKTVAAEAIAEAVVKPQTAATLHAVAVAAEQRAAAEQHYATVEAPAKSAHGLRVMLLPHVPAPRTQQLPTLPLRTAAVAEPTPAAVEPMAAAVGPTAADISSLLAAA